MLAGSLFFLLVDLRSSSLQAQITTIQESVGLDPLRTMLTLFALRVLFQRDGCADIGPGLAAFAPGMWTTYLSLAQCRSHLAPTRRGYQIVFSES